MDSLATKTTTDMLPNAKWYIVLIATIICIAINFLFIILLYLLHIPLWLDTVGTVAVTFLFGWIPGLVCAFSTTLLDSIIGNYFLQLPMLYVLCSFSAVLISYLFRKLIFNTDLTIARISYLLILAILMCTIISILGGLIDSFCIAFSSYKSDSPVAADYFKPNFIKLGLPMLGTNILARFPVNIADRLLTSFIAYGLAVCYKKIEKKAYANKHNKEISF